MKYILNGFPDVKHAFAYGSGVFRQPGLYPSGSGDDSRHNGPMIDLVFAVDDPVAWHRENLARNRNHYSFIKWFGPSMIHSMAERFGAGVYYNTLIPWSSGMIKYGVTSVASLQRDLLDWNALYLAGRLHKPVETLLSHPKIEGAQAANLESAVRTALLLLPRRFTMRQLLHTICDLSYVGDIRMGLAEDERKVDRILQGSYERLIAMYEPPLKVAESQWGAVLRRGAGGGWIEQSMASDVRSGLIASLPAMVLYKLSGALGRPIPKAALQNDPAARATLAVQVASFSQSSEVLQRSIASIVRASSRRQTFMGLFSAGILKSAMYAWKKVNKRYRLGI